MHSGLSHRLRERVHRIVMSEPLSALSAHEPSHPLLWMRTNFTFGLPGVPQLAASALRGPHRLPLVIRVVLHSVGFCFKNKRNRGKKIVESVVHLHHHESRRSIAANSQVTESKDASVVNISPNSASLSVRLDPMMRMRVRSERRATRVGERRWNTS